MIHVILNPASGAAAKPDTAQQVTALFEAAGVQAHIHPVTVPNGIADAARAALGADAIQAVVAGGGDGTVSSVASVLAGTSVPLGVLPLGTLNHFAKDLRIPMDLQGAIETVAHGRVAVVDVGRVNDRVFLNNVSIGIYPNIVERREQLRAQGRRKWPALLLATMEVLRRDHEVSVRVDSGSVAVSSKTPFVFIGNNEYRVEGVHLGERVRVDGGRLFAYLAPRVHTRQLPSLLAHALLGHATRAQGLEVLSAVDFWIDTPSSRRMKVASDGELLTVDSRLHLSSWPGALNVLVPASEAK